MEYINDSNYVYIAGALHKSSLFIKNLGSFYKKLIFIKIRYLISHFVKKFTKNLRHIKFFFFFHV